MKTKIILILLVVGFGILYAADGVISSFTAKSDGSVITVEWNTINENDAVRFELERSATENDFMRLSSEEAKGKPSSYRYIDEKAYIKRSGPNGEEILSNSVYSYRLKIIRRDNSSDYTNVVYVTHNVSSIRRTWGMIKEMFR